MAKSFYRLRDKGTTFYDMTQGAGVVADRVAPLENTARVKEAVRDGILDKLDVEEGKALYAQQQEDIKAQTEQDAKQAAQGKPGSIAATVSTVDESRATVDGGDGSNVAKTATSNPNPTEEEEEEAEEQQRANNASTAKGTTKAAKGK